MTEFPAKAGMGKRVCSRALLAKDGAMVEVDPESGPPRSFPE